MDKIRIYHIISNINSWPYDIYAYKIPEYESRIFYDFISKASEKLKEIVSHDKKAFLKEFNDKDSSNYIIFNQNYALEVNNNIDEIIDKMTDLADEIDKFDLYSIKDFKLSKNIAAYVILLYNLARDFNLYEFKKDE